METLIVHPKNAEQSLVMKAFMQALKISFEASYSESPLPYAQPEPEGSNILNEEHAPYNSEFTAKMRRSDEDFESGRFTEIKTDDLWK